MKTTVIMEPKQVLVFGKEDVNVLKQTYAIMELLYEADGNQFENDAVKEGLLEVIEDIYYLLDNYEGREI